MYAFSARGFGNPELHKFFLDKLENSDFNSLEYKSLSNIAYYLMLTDNTNDKTWQKLVDAVTSKDSPVPI